MLQTQPQRPLCKHRYTWAGNDGDKVKRQKQPLDRWLYAAYFFFPALIFAHRARCAAAILFLPAADIVRLRFGA